MAKSINNSKNMLYNPLEEKCKGEGPCSGSCEYCPTPERQRAYKATL